MNKSEPNLVRVSSPTSDELHCNRVALTEVIIKL
jgi:hypothetical protein